MLSEELEPPELIVPIAVVDPERKGVEVPTSKPRKKRISPYSPVKGTPKKRKMLSLALSVAKTSKVHLIRHSS